MGILRYIETSNKQYTWFTISRCLLIPKINSFSLDSLLASEIFVTQAAYNLCPVTYTNLKLIGQPLQD